jgi:hypothetical protein
MARTSKISARCPVCRSMTSYASPLRTRQALAGLTLPRSANRRTNSGGGSAFWAKRRQKAAALPCAAAPRALQGSRGGCEGPDLDPLLASVPAVGRAVATALGSAAPRLGPLRWSTRLGRAPLGLRRQSRSDERNRPAQHTHSPNIARARHSRWALSARAAAR